MEPFFETPLPEVPTARTLLPMSPVWEMKQKIKTMCELPSFSHYKAVQTSKCGLGKTQGTKGQFRGMSLDSFWEAAFYIWCVDIRGGSCARNFKESFKYINMLGEDANFYPDFKTTEFGFAEVKGRYRDDDILKKEATQGVVTFFGPEEMKKIIKEVNKFNPKWREEYSQIATTQKYGKKGW